MRFLEKAVKIVAASGASGLRRLGIRPQTPALLPLPTVIPLYQVRVLLSKKNKCNNSRCSAFAFSIFRFTLHFC